MLEHCPAAVSAGGVRAYPGLQPWLETTQLALFCKESLSGPKSRFLCLFSSRELCSLKGFRGFSSFLSLQCCLGLPRGPLTFFNIPLRLCSLRCLRRLLPLPR